MILATDQTASKSPGKALPKMPNKMQPQLSASLARELTVHALVDPRTLRRYLNGFVVSAMCALRIERALRKHHLERLVRAPETTTPKSTDRDPATAA